MGDFYYHRKVEKKTWRGMQRWERKQWHRDNNTSIARGNRSLVRP